MDESVKTQRKLTEEEAERIANLAKMEESELKALGYTQEQIDAFKELAKAADKVVKY